MYDKAHGTLEGLTAPYGTVADVAPQGLRDLGVSEDTGPVGVRLGDSPYWQKLHAERAPHDSDDDEEEE